MRLKLMFGGAVSMFALVACQTEGDDTEQTGDADAYIAAAGPLPTDGQCAHVIVTQLSDFHVSQFQGSLDGAVFKVESGESHVTATAYAPPCSSEPADAPWIADEQIFTFTRGANQLTLNFHANTNVVIDPVFDDNETNIVIRPGSLVRTGRNGEDAAGPNFSLDGWEVKQFTAPPPGGAGPGTDTVVFSMEGKGPPYTPRGLAHLPNGNFVAQVSETFRPLWLFDAAGNLVATDATSYPANTIVWDITDGLEAIDATHLVRTGFLNNPISCDADGNNCVQSGIEVLTLEAQGDGSTLAVVTQQILLPASIGLNAEYAVGVAPVPGGKFAVATLPTGGTHLTILNGDGTVAAGPVSLPGDVEGLFDTGTGRLATVDYVGHVQMFDDATLAVRAGETENLPNGIGFTLPNRLAWNPNANQFIALGDVDNHLATATPDFTSTAPLGIDTSGYALVTAMDVRASANQLMIADRLPPVDATSGTRIPRVDFYDLGTHAQVQHVLLGGVSTGQVRPDAAAFVDARQQVLSHYRRPGNTPDASLDGVVFTHNLDGSLAGTFDLRPLGFPKVSSVMYLPASDEILMAATDITGVQRLVVVSASGQPRRSYRTDAIAGFSALALMTSGTFAGDVGVVFSQPADYMRVSLQ
jgi:hypothetical protein